MERPPEHPPGGSVPFQISTETFAGRVVIMVRGELDLETSPLLLREVSTALLGAASSLAIDLGAITFLDSSGVRALITAQEAARDRDIPFTLATVSAQARWVLDLSGVSHLFGLPPATA